MASSCLFAFRNWLKLDSESRCSASELLNILEQIVGYSPILYHVKELLIYTNVQLHSTWKFKLLLILMTTSVISIRNIQSYVRLSCVLSWEHCFHAFGSASVIAFWSPGRSPHSIRNKRTKRPGRGTMGLRAAALSSWPSIRPRADISLLFALPPEIFTVQNGKRACTVHMPLLSKSIDQERDSMLSHIMLYNRKCADVYKESLCLET